MSAYVLDAPELYRRLDVKRQERGISWRAVGRETGISPMIFTRLKQDHSPDAHALLTLLVWLDLDDGLSYVIKPKESA